MKERVKVLTTEFRFKKYLRFWLAVLVVSLALGFGSVLFFKEKGVAVVNRIVTKTISYKPKRENLSEEEREFLNKLELAAKDRLNYKVTYDPTYFSIPYPNGDVPSDKGVCTDEIIRSYRNLGIDLQELVHEDMAANFKLYPKNWGLSKTDTNIDHRRVPNLMVFFGRKGESLEISDEANDYVPGDLVTWDLHDGQQHIGIVVDEVSSDGERPLIVHNVGSGPQMNDVLFRWEIIGHYRYYGK